MIGFDHKAKASAQHNAILVLFPKSSRARCIQVTFRYFSGVQNESLHKCVFYRPVLPDSGGRTSASFLHRFWSNHLRSSPIRAVRTPCILETSLAVI